jgi:hypothetical protein
MLRKKASAGAQTPRLIAEKAKANPKDAAPFFENGARIFPDMFSLATAHKAFAGDDLADPSLRARFETNVQAFLSLAEAAKNYACMKRAWVEFLGETPGGAADRVDPVGSPQ